MTIKTRILIPMIILTALAAISVLASNVLQFSRYIDEDTKQLLDSASIAAFKQIDIYKTYAKSISAFMMNDRDVIEALKNSDREALLRYAVHVYTNMITDKTGSYFCTITDASGTVLVRTHEPQLYGDNMSQMPRMKLLLSGGSFNATGYGPVVRMSVGSGTPIYDEQNRLVGTVIIGYRLDTDEFVDSLAATFNCEVTVFLEDERVATTIRDENGTRITGTRAPREAAEKVLAGEIYTGGINQMGKSVMSKYVPIRENSGNVIGMLFVGYHLSAKSDMILSFVMTGAFFLSALLAVAVPLMTLMSKRIASPINEASKVLSEIAGGNFDARLEGSQKGDLASLQNAVNDTALKLSVYLKEKIQDDKIRKLAAIVDIADAGIIVIDMDGIVREWNIGAENILGYKPEEVIGRTTKYYTPDEYYPIIDEIIKLLISGKHFTNKEIMRRHKDGRLIYSSASHTPIFDENNQFSGAVTVFHDISEKKFMERALEEALKAAEDASEAKSMFLANMSHEIRTPLNGVVGFTELALDDGSISDNVREHLNKIKNSADGLLEIVNDILDLSKVESGRMELEKIPFDLHRVLQDCKSIIELKASEKSIMLYFYAEPFGGKRLVGDPTKLRQALLNLLSNAVKFTNHGIVKLTAAVEKEEDNRATVLFEVKDSGIGMDAGQIENIFAPFIQADASTTRKYGGTGLGLALTKNFVEMMGGALSVESAPDLGSKFSFTLTFETIAAAEENSAAAIGNEPILRKPTFSGEVLICEDNHINRDVIINHLVRVGLTPTVAENGKQGLDYANERAKNGKQPFDLIFMDIHMPVMDGLEAAQKLIEAGNKTPIIALTANAIKDDKEKYFQHGMSDYLTKPFTSQELWACLLRHLTPIAQDPQSGAEDFLDADAGTDTDTEEQPLLADDVLDEALGVKRTSGDIQLYRRIQKNFVKDYRNVVQELNGAFASGETKLAHRVAHSLKNSARMIGAENLACAAYDIEAAFSAGNTSRYQEQIATLESALRELFERLAAAAPEEKIVPKKSGAVLDVLDVNEAAALAETLGPLLESGSPSSLDFIDKITLTFAPMGEICNKLITQIEDYEFEDALAILLRIKALLAEKQTDLRS